MYPPSQQAGECNPGQTLTILAGRTHHAAEGFEAAEPSALTILALAQEIRRVTKLMQERNSANFYLANAPRRHAAMFMLSEADEAGMNEALAALDLIR